MGQLTSVYALTEDQADWVRRRQNEALERLEDPVESRKDPKGGRFQLATIVHKRWGRIEIPTTHLDKAWPDMRCALAEFPFLTKMGFDVYRALMWQIPLKQAAVLDWAEASLFPAMATGLLRSGLTKMAEKSARAACASVDEWAREPHDLESHVKYVVEYLIKLRDFLRAKCPGGKSPRCLLFCTS